MVEVTVTLSDEQFSLLKKFADEKGITPSELFRRIILDWLEDEEDIRDAEAAYQEYLKNPVTYTLAEIEAELNSNEISCKVELMPAVRDKLQTIDAPIRARIKTWIETNLEGCENPRLHGEALHGDLKDFWKYQVGDYRIIAKIFDDKVVILVVKIDKRGDIY